MLKRLGIIMVVVLIIPNNKMCLRETVTGNAGPQKPGAKLHTVVNERDKATKALPVQMQTQSTIKRRATSGNSKALQMKKTSGKRDTFSSLLMYLAIPAVRIIHIAIILCRASMNTDSSYRIPRNRADKLADLGLPRTASDTEAKKAYKQLSLLYHPDKNSDKTLPEQADLAEKFKKICNAYHALGVR